ncbi:MAG: hypothetical protein K0S56_2765 [Microvirga sp.]|jgi:hypothetical protein|nr:hypothetical protein [Microvirga sp.]
MNREIMSVVTPWGIAAGLSIFLVLIVVLVQLA